MLVWAFSTGIIVSKSPVSPVTPQDVTAVSAGLKSPAEQENFKKGQELIPFSFEKRNLVDIIDFLASKKNINVILPQPAADAEAIRKQTITFQPEGRTTLPLDEAWSLLTMFLELSGFSLVPKRSNLYAIVRTGRPEEAGISRETLPLYVGTAPEQLPKSEQRIRYIYYLRNLKTPGTDDRDTNPLARIFRDMLSPGAPVIPEPKSNGFIIVDRADIITSVMKIISELDATGFRETIAVIPIHNLPARDIVRVFESLRKAAGQDGTQPPPFIRSDSKGDVSYFAADTKIISDDRTNALILMGRETAVERISDFVHEFMDVPQESGQSILHTYDLQYLDAQTFAGVLQNIVSPAAAGTQATQGPITGPERSFQGVVVAAEEVKTVDIKTTTEEVTVEQRGDFAPTGIEGKIFTGGNRLIVAAIQDDWIHIKDLIETLDKPQPQVILEVMIVDFRTRRDKLIASTIRNRTDSTILPNAGVQFLASHISDPVNVLANPPTRLAEDLLTLTGGPDAVPRPVTTLLAEGSLIISFNDPRTPGISALLQVFDEQVDSKILSHPYLVTTNNQKATITSQILKRDRGDAVPGAAGVTTVEIVDVPATIQVQMIPRLSSLERLGLQIAVDINEFVAVGSFDRITRRVNVNTNLGTGQVLIIGGLTRIDTSDLVTETPFFSKIPLIGNLFKRTSKITVKSNIAIFIAPTIVQPRLRAGLTLYTTDKIRKGRRDVADENIFTNMRDPITYLYFRPGPKSDHIIEQYLSHVANPPDAELIKTTREKRRERRRPIRPRPSTKTQPVALPPAEPTVAEVPA